MCDLNYSEVLEDILIYLRPIAPPDDRINLGPTTSLLTDIDLDSLALLDFVEYVKGKYRLDLLSTQTPFESLSSPAAIAKAIVTSGRGFE